MTHTFSKPQYLLDECVTTNFPFLIEKSKNTGFVSSIKKVGRGAKDEEVFEFAKKKNLTVVTNDQRFSLHMLLENKTIVYQFRNGSRIKIKPIIEPMDHVAIFHDEISAHALEFDEIPKPDLVLISHAHMDHMDYKSLKELTKKYPGKVNCITAYNTKDIIEDLNWKTLTELDWGESLKLDELKITGIEVNHDGFRLPGELDRAKGHMLYGRSYNGYILESNGKKILFAGDTAYTEKFKQHRDKNIDVVIMPIGGYIPHHHRHCDPEEALIMASEHIGAKYFVPIHANTFDGDEGFHVPIDWMNKSVEKYDIKIGISEIGQTLTLNAEE